MSRRAARAAGLATLLLVASTAATRADRIHLVGGGAIEAARWWIEDDTVFVVGPAGTVGLPRARVVAIEPTAAPPADGAPSSPPSPTSRPEVPSSLPSSDRQSRPGPGANGVAPEATALVEAGRRAAAAGDAAGARDHFAAALALAPQWNEVRVGLAAAAMALGADARALDTVLAGLARAPDHPGLRELLGDLREREGRTEDAVREWRRAQRVAPAPELAAKLVRAERDLAVAADDATAGTGRFTLRYDGRLPAQVAEEVLDHLEASFAELSVRFAYVPSRPIRVLLYPEVDFRSVTGADAAIAGLYDAHDGTVRLPVGHLTRLDPTVRRVLTHELAHAIVHGKSAGRCPRWLHEGLAQLVDGTAVPPAALDGSGLAAVARGPCSLPVSYPEAWSIVDHLRRERGAGSLNRILERLGRGEDLDAALSALGYRGVEGLCREWRGELARRAGR